MDIIIAIFSLLLIIGGIAGCFLPILPGVPLAYVGLLLLHFAGIADFSVTQLLVWLLLLVVLQVLDYISPMLGSKYSGGTEYGNRGCIAGTVLGLFFMPWGIVLGPFIGAVVGELLGENDMQHAIRAGFGSFLGFVVSVLLKVILCVYFLVVYIVALF